MRREAFAGKVAIVTGGTSGIGQQVAIDLANAGAQVVACGLTGATFSQPNIDVRICDVRDDAAVAQLVAHAQASYGPIDILINNAGAAVYRPFEESTSDEVLDILNVNLGGAYRFAKAVLPTMTSRRSGAIVNIASIGGELIITPNAAYCGAKHGMVAWSKALRYELARFNISVTAICPDHVPTHFQDHPTFLRRNKYRKKKQGSLTVNDVSAAILSSIETKRAMTYVPGWLGMVVWFSQTFAWILEPVWGRMIAKRMDQVYLEIENERRIVERRAS